MADIPNVQQLLDNHVFDNLQSDWGTGAAGDNWIKDPDNNIKNKHAIKREYRTLDSRQVEELVQGMTRSDTFGVIIITNTRIVLTPTHILGKKYGARYEIMIYSASYSAREKQLGGSRKVYEINRDITQTLIDNPFPIHQNIIPFNIQTLESDNTTDQVDLQRVLAIIPVSKLRLL